MKKPEGAKEKDLGCIVSQGPQFPTLYNDWAALGDLCSLPAEHSRILEIH